MPKINFYIDIPVGTKPTDDLTAMTRPYQKYPGTKRFKVIIDRIALWLCLNFYPDNYVNFELSNTVGGVLSQIDNMVAGLKQ